MEENGDITFCDCFDSLFREYMAQLVQYDKKYSEEVGLVKFDFLGLKTLTIIKDAIDFVKKFVLPVFGYCAL